MIKLCQVFREEAISKDFLENYGLNIPSEDKLLNYITEPLKIWEYIKLYSKYMMQTINQFLNEFNAKSINNKQKQETENRDKDYEIDCIYNTFKAKEFQFLKKE